MPDSLLKIDQLNTYSEEVQEIVGQPPKKFVQWGTSFFILILLIVVSVSCFVKYSDVVSGEFILTATNSPKSIIARRNGKLVELFVKNNDSVLKGQVLGWLESTASHHEVLVLSDELEVIWERIRNNQWEKIADHRPDEYKKLGEIQSAYQTFISNYIELCAYLNNGIYIQKKKLFKQELENLRELNNYQNDQEKIYQQDYLIAKEDFKAKEQLYEEKVIPLLEYSQEKSKLLAKKVPIDIINSALINNNTSIVNKSQELVQVEKQFSDQKSSFLQALNTLISVIDEWKTNYLLIAPVSGKVTWPLFLRQNQDVVAEQELFYISPFSFQYFGEMYISQQMFGKIQTDQEVLINLSGYPYSEYGKLHGKVTFISEFPISDLTNAAYGKYYAAVSLTNDLHTDLGQSIPFRNGLSGSGDIIVRKTKLINKFLYSLREVINKPHQKVPPQKEGKEK